MYASSRRRPGAVHLLVGQKQLHALALSQHATYRSDSKLNGPALAYAHATTKQSTRDGTVPGELACGPLSFYS